MKKLTPSFVLEQNPSAAPHWAAGFRSLFHLGVNTPLLTVVFLCQKISLVSLLADSSRYGVAIRGVERLAAPKCGTANPSSHVARLFAVTDGGYSTFHLGSRHV